MSVFNLRVYSKKWQTHTRVCRFSYSRKSKNYLTYRHIKGGHKKGATSSPLMKALPFGWEWVVSITVFFADLSIPTSDCEFGMFLNRSLSCYGNSLSLSVNNSRRSVTAFCFGNPLVSPWGDIKILLCHNRINFS